MSAFTFAMRDTNRAVIGNVDIVSREFDRWQGLWYPRHARGAVVVCGDGTEVEVVRSGIEAPRGGKATLSRLSASAGARPRPLETSSPSSSWLRPAGEGIG